MLQVLPTTCPKCGKSEEYLAIQTGDGKCVCKHCGCPIIFDHKDTSQTILEDQIEQLKKDNQRLFEKHINLAYDLVAYRGALGYAIPADHDGRLTDGSTPVNGIADAVCKQLEDVEKFCKTLEQELSKCKDDCLEWASSSNTYSEMWEEAIKQRNAYYVELRELREYKKDIENATEQQLNDAQSQTEERLAKSALKALLDRYVGIAESGDCGFWDCEKEIEVINARAALNCSVLKA